MKNKNSKVDKSVIQKDLAADIEHLITPRSRFLSKSEGDDDIVSNHSGSENLFTFDIITTALIELMKGRSAKRLQDYFDHDAEFLVSRVNLMQVFD